MPCATTTAPPTAATVLLLRLAAMGMSVSFLLGLCCVCLDRRDDGLDRDASTGRQLAAGTTDGGAERRGPEVLPDQYGGGAAGLDGLDQVDDVLLAQQHRELTLEGAQLTDVAVLHVRGLEDLEAPVEVPGQEDQVQDPDQLPVDQVLQDRRHLAGHLALREFDDDPVDGAQLIDVDAHPVLLLASSTRQAARLVQQNAVSWSLRAAPGRTADMPPSREGGRRLCPSGIAVTDAGS